MQISYKHICKITIPVLVSLLMEYLIGFTDTAYLGRVGEDFIDTYKCIERKKLHSIIILLYWHRRDRNILFGQQIGFRYSPIL